MAHPAPSQFYPRFGHCVLLDLIEDEPEISNLHTRLITSPTRELLLSGQQPWISSTSPGPEADAITLLSSLSRLAPSIAKDFIPKNHAENNFPFRLINDVNDHGENVGYIAMSYCRTTSTPKITSPRIVSPIVDLPFGWQKKVEQFPLPTSAAISQAVLQERRKGEGLWYDQVCVNQEDIEEKSMVVGAIDTIYKNARAIIVALDDIAATPEEVQFLQVYIEQYSYSELPYPKQPNSGMSPPFMHQFTALKSFFRRIMTSAWFDCAWCAHELRMGQDYVFLVPCGTYYEDEKRTVIRFTGAFLVHLLVLASELYDLSPPTHTRTQTLLRFFQRRLKKIESDCNPFTTLSDKCSIVSLIEDTFHMHAGGNPRLPEYLRRLDANRDKTCIALNASGLPLSLAPPTPFSRPDIEDECLRSLLLVGLAARDPVSLCTTGTPLQLHDGSVSWLCRTTPLESISARPPPPRFHVEANTIVQASDGRAEYAQLDLVFLDLPHRTEPKSFFPAHISRARVFIDLCIQHAIPGSGLWTFSRTHDHVRSPSLRNSFIQTLACVFDCGAQWLLEVSASLQQPPSLALDPYTIDILLNPHLILQNYIQLEEGRNAFSLIISLISTLVASGIPWASGASEHTHGPLIISAPALSWPQNVTPCSVIGGRAIIFAPFEHSRTLLVAVPDAVKSAEYDDLARGWILTSMNPFTGSPKSTVSWTLQSKGVIFGDINFNAGLMNCGEMDKRNHRVYGPSAR